VSSAPPEIRGPARLGMLLMTPWTAAIAYRRFQQGVLIRFGSSRVIGVGTAVRLLANGSMLAAGALLTSWPGIAVGTAAIAVGVTCEALFVGIRARPVVRDTMPAHDPGARPLTRASFLRFYTPLALTSLMTLAGLPLGSAAMGRMPLVLESLAVWPVINGLSFTLRSRGLAYNEVVVALMDRDGAFDALRSFAIRLGAIASGVLLLLAATPLAHAWFVSVSALPPDLADLAKRAVWLAIPLPAGSVAQALFAGVLVHHHRTRAISESVAIQVAVLVALLTAGARLDAASGIYVMIAANVTAIGMQLLWLVRRAAPSIAESRRKGAAATAAVALGILAVASIPAPARAEMRVPDGFTVEHVLGGPFDTPPVGFAFLPDGRFVLVERQSGRVRVAAAGDSTSQAVLKIPDVNANHVERGLLGVAVDPFWPARPHLYFHYTSTAGDVRVVRYEASGPVYDPARADLSLGHPFVLLAGIDDTMGIHNAGTLRFAPDGTLLVSVGEDGQFCPAQDLASPLGKLLRLDVSSLPPGGPEPPPLAALAPANNPFPGAPGWGPLIWAWGLRNPFRFTVDPRNGRAFVGSVGWTQYEEINVVPPFAAGPNFGWPQREGPDPVDCCEPCGAQNEFTDPIFVVPHPFGPASILGGAVLHAGPSDGAFPIDYDGDYVFAEIFSGELTRLHETAAGWDVANPVAGQPSDAHWGDGFPGVTDIQRGRDGALYLLSFGLSPDLFPVGLYRIRRTPSPPPPEAALPPSPPILALRAEPNPAHAGGGTVLAFRALRGGVSGIRILDASGRTVRHAQVAGAAGAERRFPFDGRDDDGRALASGIYFVAVRPPGGAERRTKLVWIR
ncbi:PQQ-dependent sugar dehydrogenase, partial [bacterium]|nr:PQQ-dependent sugar dehydrogenase [bacterium]